MSVSGVEEKEIDVLEHFWVSGTCRSQSGNEVPAGAAAEQPQGSGQLSGSSVVAQCDLCVLVCVQELQLTSFLMRNRSQNPWGWCESHCFSVAAWGGERWGSHRPMWALWLVGTDSTASGRWFPHPPAPFRRGGMSFSHRWVDRICDFWCHSQGGGRDRAGKEPGCCLPLLQKCLLWVKRVSNARF